MNLEQQICKAVGKPRFRKGQDRAEFLTALATAIDELPSDDWDALPQAAKDWSNSAAVATRAGQPVPEIEEAQPATEEPPPDTEAEPETKPKGKRMPKSAKPAAESDARKPVKAKTTKEAPAKPVRAAKSAKNGAGKSAKTTTKAKAAPERKRVGKAKSSSARSPVRDGSKLKVISGLLTRKNGCTRAEVLAATGWKAISMQQQADHLGLTLRQEKDGRSFRYFAA